MKTKKIIMVELVETNVFSRWHCTVVTNLQGGPNPPGFPTTGRDVAYTMPNSRLNSATSTVSMVRIVSIACVRRLACRSIAARIFSTSCPAASTSLASVSKSAFTEFCFPFFGGSFNNSAGSTSRAVASLPTILRLREEHTFFNLA